MNDEKAEGKGDLAVERWQDWRKRRQRRRMIRLGVPEEVIRRCEKAGVSNFDWYAGRQEAGDRDA